MNSADPVAIPEPHALMMNKTAEMIRIARRPILSAKVPAKNAPTPHPKSIEATLNPVATLSELKASLRPSTVPLMTPLSKPNKKPPIVATRLIRNTNPVLVVSFFIDGVWCVCWLG
jgi:hypothetical protein